MDEVQQLNAGWLHEKSVFRGLREILPEVSASVGRRGRAGAGANIAE
jgi:hypothetical protein